MAVGGKSALDSALARGAVTRATNDQGVELFFFPTMKVGSKESTAIVQASKRLAIHSCWAAL